MKRYRWRIAEEYARQYANDMNNMNHAALKSELDDMLRCEIRRQIGGKSLHLEKRIIDNAVNFIIIDSVKFKVDGDFTNYCVGKIEACLHDLGESQNKLKDATENGFKSKNDLFVLAGLGTNILRLAKKLGIPKWHVLALARFDALASFNEFDKTTSRVVLATQTWGIDPTFVRAAIKYAYALKKLQGAGVNLAGRIYASGSSVESLLEHDLVKSDLQGLLDKFAGELTSLSVYEKSLDIAFREIDLTLTELSLE